MRNGGHVKAQACECYRTIHEVESEIDGALLRGFGE